LPKLVGTRVDHVVGRLTSSTARGGNPVSVLRFGRATLLRRIADIIEELPAIPAKEINARILQRRILPNADSNATNSRRNTGLSACEGRTCHRLVYPRGHISKARICLNGVY